VAVADGLCVTPDLTLSHPITLCNPSSLYHTLSHPITLCNPSSLYLTLSHSVTLAHSITLYLTLPHSVILSNSVSHPISLYRTASAVGLSPGCQRLHLDCFGLRQGRKARNPRLFVPANRQALPWKGSPSDVCSPNQNMAGVCGRKRSE
jgi:hypothetical protein